VRRALFLAVAFLVAGVAIAGAADPSLEVHLDPRKIGIEDATVLVVRILEPEGTPEVDLGALEQEVQRLDLLLAARRARGLPRDPIAVALPADRRPGFAKPTPDEHRAAAFGQRVGRDRRQAARVLPAHRLEAFR